MKRVGYLFEQVHAFPALLTAFHRARKGKAGRPSVERFARRREPELLHLQRELVSGTYRPSPTTTFEVFDPKPRTITVAPFRDRVLHHALIAVIAPHLERRFDPDSYGCRVGKGTDGALSRALHLARRHPHALRADVSAFFASIPHLPLLALLQRHFKDRRLLALLEAIVATPKGRGLPIGHLTSQWLANAYLTSLDRAVRQHPACLAYVRYMDDLVLFGASSAALRDLRAHLTEALRDLGLRLNPRVTHPYRTRAGFPFLGYRVSPRGLRIRATTWRRLQTTLRRRERAHLRGHCSSQDLAHTAQSVVAHLERAQTQGLRRAWIARAPPVTW